VVFYNDALFMYGGYTAESEPSAEIWKFDLNTKRWKNMPIADQPKPAAYVLPLSICCYLVIHRAFAVRATTTLL
jgi:hypothetical protein